LYHTHRRDPAFRGASEMRGLIGVNRHRLRSGQRDSIHSR
jgi:hypothetical protein